MTRSSAQPQERRTQAERRAETRRRLVEAAMAVLAEEGYARLTISKVSARAGLTNGAVQHHFPTRDDLVLALVDAVYPVLRIPFEQLAAEGLGLRQRSDRVVELFWDIYRRPEYLAVWDIALGSRADPAVAPRLRAYQREVVAHVRAELSALFADTDIPVADLEQTFSLAVNCLRGLALQGLFAPARPGELELIKELAFERLGRAARL